MKYPFKFTHYVESATIYTANKDSQGMAIVSWDDSINGKGSADYTSEQVKKYIADGTWQVVEE